MSGDLNGLDQLGTWATDDLAATARANVGVGADADLPQEVRFVAGVAKLLRRRLAKEGANADPARPAIFLLEPTPRTNNLDAKPKRVPMLDNGLTPIAGRLWFVSPVVVAGNYIDLDKDDDDELFGIVTDILQLGDVPAIVFDPRTKPATVRFYPAGLSNVENYNPVGLSVEVTLQRIYEAIDHVYKNCLITPEAQARAGKLWVNGEKCWPSPTAEDCIQLYLRAGLTTAFPNCTIRHEQTVAAGRYDLEVEESDPLDRGNVRHHAVLELKVLRSFRSTGTPVPPQETLDWIRLGVQQAASYRDDIGAAAAALCCFDMRRQHTGDQCFEHVKDFAAKIRVELRLWFLFGSSEQYRDFITRNS